MHKETVKDCLTLLLHGVFGGKTFTVYIETETGKVGNEMGPDGFKNVCCGKGGRVSQVAK